MGATKTLAVCRCAGGVGRQSYAEASWAALRRCVAVEQRIVGELPYVTPTRARRDKAIAHRKCSPDKPSLRRASAIQSRAHRRCKAQSNDAILDRGRPIVMPSLGPRVVAGDEANGSGATSRSSRRSARAPSGPLSISLCGPTVTVPRGEGKPAGKRRIGFEAAGEFAMPRARRSSRVSGRNGLEAFSIASVVPSGRGSCEGLNAISLLLGAGLRTATIWRSC